MGIEKHLGPWNAALGDVRTALAIIVPAEVAVLSGVEVSAALGCAYLAYAWAVTTQKRSMYDLCGQDVMKKGWTPDICKRYGRVAEVWAEANGQLEQYRQVRLGGWGSQRS